MMAFTCYYNKKQAAGSLHFLICNFLGGIILIKLWVAHVSSSSVSQSAVFSHLYQNHLVAMVQVSGPLPHPIHPDSEPLGCNHGI